MAEHTPGPWIDGRDYVRAAGGVYVIAQCYVGCDTTRTEARENARLIAAAPELLAALEEVVSLSDRKHVAWDRARAAMAKAKGGAPTRPAGDGDAARTEG